MEPCKDSVSSDYCVPGWSAKSVTRMDQSNFYQEGMHVDFVIFKYGKSYTDIDVTYVPSPDKNKDAHDEVVLRVESLPHVRFEMTFQCLYPHADLEDGLAREMEDKKANIEKQIRSMITTASKAAAKAANAAEKKRAKAKAKAGVKVKNGKHGQGQGDGMAEFFSSLGLVMPDDHEERQQKLQEIIDHENQLESLVQKARDGIKMPTQILISKMVGNEERQSRCQRAKVMQEALKKAKADINATDGKDESSLEVSFQLGPCAAANNYKESGMVTILNKRSSKKSDQLCKDVVGLGKHLMR